MNTGSLYDWALVLTAFVAFGSSCAFTWQAYLDEVVRAASGQNGVLRRMAWIGVGRQAFRATASAFILFAAVHKFVGPLPPFTWTGYTTDMTLLACAVALVAVNALEGLKRIVT